MDDHAPKRCVRRAGGSWGSLGPGKRGATVFYAVAYKTRTVNMNSTLDRALDRKEYSAATRSLRIARTSSNAGTTFWRSLSQWLRHPQWKARGFSSAHAGDNKASFEFFFSR